MSICLSSLRLHLVGCGKMGSALLAAWLRAGLLPENARVRVATQANAIFLQEQLGVTAATDTVYDGEDAVVFAVKPQIVRQVIAESWNSAPHPPLYLSIAAGIPLSTLQPMLGSAARIIRAMPNTPALVGQGVSTLLAGPCVTAADVILAETLFNAAGIALWMDSEEEMDAATAVSGSGPAYVFHFLECLIEAGTSIGLSSEKATLLAIQTLKGSVTLAEREGWNISQLRQNVTSKGGVTAAALDVLQMELPSIFEKALAANMRRSRELAAD